MKQWTRKIASSVLPLSILAILSKRESYGYEIRKMLVSFNLGDFNSGTVYPLLTRLEEEGLIASRWAELHDDPPRKMIQITDTGRDALKEGVQDVEYLLSGIRNVMEGK